MSAQNRRLTHCNNCENELEQADAFCRRCGQKNLDRKVPFWVFIWEFIESNLHLDARLWLTLKYFLFRPGFLTVEFIEGKRKRYIFPIQLFLFVGFICFLFIALYVDQSLSDEELKDGNFKVTQIDHDPSEDNLVEAFFRKQLAKAEENPVLFIENSLQKIPFVLLVLLPLFAMVHKLFYIRHKIYLVEHMVFLLHTHAFLFVLILIAVALGAMGLLTAWLLSILILTMLVYLIIAFRTVYLQAWWKTFIKFFLLTGVYFILMPGLLLLGGVLAGLVS